MSSFNSYIVDKKILKNNAMNIKKVIGDNVKFCAVVKADGYGIGSELICKTLNGIADYFAVANLKEALKIRGFDKETKILILGIVPDSELEICANNNISISVSNNEYLHKCTYAGSLKLNIHLQVNTGLNRFGYRSQKEFSKALKIIESKENFNLEGIYSHFATKSNDIKFIKIQYMKFMQFKKLVKNNGVVFHIANSYATLFNSKFHLDMVRDGFLLYGESENNIGNKPVLTIKSKIINICNIKRGESVGYDRTYTAKVGMQIGVVPIGYADGFDRRLSNNFSVLVGGKKVKVIGRICMDVFIIDLTQVDANIYDEVVILGRQGNAKITLDDYANALDTSPYEILLKFRYERMNYIEI